MNDFQFLVDVSRTFRNKDGYAAGGYKLNTSFQTETHTPSTFVQTVIKEGWPYTMVHSKRSPEETGAISRNVHTPKHIENFISSQVITLDDDRGTPNVVEEWLNDPFFARYGFAFVESSSSTPEKQKGHAIFLLENPVTDIGLYSLYLRAACYNYINKVDWLVNADRTIYNGQDKPIYMIGKTLPNDLFEREILLPFRKNEELKLQDIYEKKRQLETIQHGSDKFYESYLSGYIRWLTDHIAKKSKGENRNIAIYWAGRVVDGIKQTGWAQPYLYLLDGIEDRIVEACRENGYLVEYANNNPAEVYRIFNIGMLAGGTPLEQPADNRLSKALKRVTPRLSDDQVLQAVRETQRVVEQLAEEKAWIKFHRFLKEHGIELPYPDELIDHFMLGLRPKTIDRDTGEIISEAITLPYATTDGTIVSVEYRSPDDNFTYDGQSSLYHVRPLFDEDTTGVIILPDSFLAIDYYLRDTNKLDVYGLPHTNSLDIIELPDKERFCIFDDNSSIDSLEQLAESNVRFVKVSSVDKLSRLVDKKTIEAMVRRGKPLKDVI